MKRPLLLSLALGGLLFSADIQKYDFSFMIGAIFPDSRTHLDAQEILGAELQFYEYGSYFVPEIQLLQTMETDYLEYTGAGGGEPVPPKNPFNGTVFITRIAVNGVHDFDIGTPWWIPFFKVGLGYETLNDDHYFDNVDCMFAEAGGGLKYYTGSRFAIKIEALYLKKLNEPRWDNNIGGFLGFAYRLGGPVGEEGRAESKK